jgi:hypothetical protein
MKSEERVVTAMKASLALDDFHYNNFFSGGFRC